MGATGVGCFTMYTSPGVINVKFSCVTVHENLTFITPGRCRILFRYPRRLRIGSRRQGRGRGRSVDCDSCVRATESACLSVGVVLQLRSCQSTVEWEKDARWLFADLPQSGAGPAPKQFDGHDVSLRFSITHGFAHPVAVAAAMPTTIVMGQGWRGENFFWGS